MNELNTDIKFALRLHDTFFEKVSYENYCRNGEVNPDIPHVRYDDIILPRRATSKSAGYDFYMTRDCKLKPGESTVIDTYIKCKIDGCCFLAIFPKSGLGFKYRVGLANTVGIIDSDYYNNPANEGHIMVKLVNSGDKAFSLKIGDKFCQGIFLPYGITVDDDVDGKRIGGFGSTGK